MESLKQILQVGDVVIKAVIVMANVIVMVRVGAAVHGVMVMLNLAGAIDFMARFLFLPLPKSYWVRVGLVGEVLLLANVELLLRVLLLPLHVLHLPIIPLHPFKLTN